MTKQTVQRVAAGLVLLAGLGAAAWWWHSHGGAFGKAAPLEPLILATNTSYVAMCPILAAQQQGYFTRHGIAAQIQPHTNGKASLQAALDGQAHLGTVADIPIMFAVMEQVPVAVVATYFRAERDHGIVGRKDLGVTAPPSLKGKRVGVTLGTSNHFVLNAFLNRQHLAASEVTMVNMKPEEFGAALLRGDVDAVSGWEPYLDTVLKQLGPNGVMFDAEDLYEIPYNIAGTRDYVRSHPETIKKLLRALIDGNRYCAEQPEAAQAMTGALLKSDSDKWRELWPTYHFAVGLDQALLVALEDQTRWAMANRLASERAVPNFLSAIDYQPLKTVAPAAVTVIH